MDEDAIALLIERAYQAGFAKGVEERQAYREAKADAAAALEHDDSEWADRQRGYGQSDDLCINDAGELLGYM